MDALPPVFKEKPFAHDKIPAARLHDTCLKTPTSMPVDVGIQEQYLLVAVSFVIFSVMPKAACTETFLLHQVTELRPCSMKSREASLP